MSNNWRPDWRKAEEYDYLTEKTSSEAYAWEFLRRNLIYQKDFELNKDLVKEEKFCYIPRNMAKDINGRNIAWRDDMRNWYGLSFHSDNYDPSIDLPPVFEDLAGGQLYPYITDSSGSSSEIYIYKEKSNANEYKNFTTLSSCRDSNIGKEIIYIELCELPEKKPEPGEFNVRMSAEYDVEEQLMIIRKFHTQYKKKLDQKKFLVTEDKKKYFKVHIRILDALFTEGSYDGKVSKKFKDEIHNIIFTKQDREDSTINHHIETARMLRDGGYIRIVNCKIRHPRPDENELEKLLQHPNKPSSFRVNLKTLEWFPTKIPVKLNN
ncbi:MAG: hypothetical protein JNL77_09555 [Nitrosomonas sp.]|nr:hypothetical protein [Nitrosomonas sp.]